MVGFKARKKKFVLHIGMNKTGTSAIQTFLFKNRKELAKKGINYPNIGSMDVDTTILQEL